MAVVENDQNGEAVQTEIKRQDANYKKLTQAQRDALREHGDRVQFEEIKNTSIGQ